MTQIIRMTGANGEGLELKKYEDILFPNLDLVDPALGLKYAAEFQYRHGDIVMCAYPKAGNHWMANMLWKLKTLEPCNRPRDTLIEFGPPEAFDEQEDPRIVFTHLKPRRIFPARIEDKGKIVLVLRNPKDVAVSYFHHLRTAALLKNKQTWDEFFESFVKGEIHMGSYFEYLKEWERVLKDISTGTCNSSLQVGVFYYEDMLLQPNENIERLNTFLGFHRDDAYLEKVLKETTMDALKGHYDTHSETLVNAFCSGDNGKSVVFRKGKVGDWKNHLSETQSEAIDKKLKDTLPFGLIKFKYDI